MTNQTTPFSHLTDDQIGEAMERALLYAVRKVGGRPLDGGVKLTSVYGEADKVTGLHPDLQPQDLVSRSIDDTFRGKRAWNSTKYSLDEHLESCINSYVSNYWNQKSTKIREHTRMTRNAGYTDKDANKVVVGLPGRRAADGGRRAADVVAADVAYVEKGFLQYSPPQSDLVFETKEMNEHFKAAIQSACDQSENGDRIDQDPSRPGLPEIYALVGDEGLDLDKDVPKILKRLGMDSTVGSADYQYLLRSRTKIRSIISDCVHSLQSDSRSGSSHH